MAFRARNSAYQNIRFNFSGSYWDATKIFIFWGIFGNILTLGLLFPYVQYLQTRFLVEKSGYGKSDFEFKAGGSDFYIVYLVALGIMMGASIIVGIISAVGMGGIMASMGDVSQAEPEKIGAMVSAIMMPFMIVLYLAFFAYIQSRMGNLVWNNIIIKGNSFECSLRARDLMWLYFSNMVAIIVSFGLLVPWAKIRMARYRVSKLELLATDNLDEFVQAERNQVSALGEEMGDVFDIDIGI